MAAPPPSEDRDRPAKKKKIPAVIHTRNDAARTRTLAKRVADRRLADLLGWTDPSDRPAPDPLTEEVAWIDLELELEFDEPVEIYIDCPEKATAAKRGFRCLFLLEPDPVSGAAKRLAALPADVTFDAVFGHFPLLGHRVRFFGHGGTWVPRGLIAKYAETTSGVDEVEKKLPLASLICGDKTACRGHRVRRALWDAVADASRRTPRVADGDGGGGDPDDDSAEPIPVVRFASSRTTTTTQGNSSSDHHLLPNGADRVLGARIQHKAVEAVAPFRYHVAIENVMRCGYFSEKLIDCFLLKTVPIYVGCPDLGAFFDPAGVVEVADHDPDDESEAEVAAKILTVLREELRDEANYEKRRTAIDANFQKALDWINLDDRVRDAVESALRDSKQDPKKKRTRPAPGPSDWGGSPPFWHVAPLEHAGGDRQDGPASFLGDDDDD